MSIFTIIDIFPAHVGYLVSLDILGAIKEILENPPMELIDLVEQCIKCCERISQDQQRPVLLKGLLEMCFNMIDFFDVSTQNKIINILMNVADRAECEQEFKENLLPVLQRVCEMVSCNYSEPERVEKLTLILSRIAQSFMHFAESLEVDKLSNFYDSLLS